MKIPWSRTPFGPKAHWLFLLVVLCVLPTSHILGTDLTNRLDFDGDGAAELAVFNDQDPGRTQSYHQTANWRYMNLFTQATTVVQWGWTTDVPIPGDYDGDRKTDQVIFRWASPFGAPFELNQIWINRSSINLDCYYNPEHLEPCPIRGFGNVYSRKLARNFILETPTPTPSTTPSPTATPTGSPTAIPQRAELGDFQRVNLAGPSDTPNYQYTFYWEIPGSLDYQVTNTGGYPATYIQVPVADDYYNNDGVSEIAVFDVTAGTYRVWPTKHSSTWDSYPLGSGVTIPVPGDYDGDGKTDFAGVRDDGTNLQWVIWYSGGGSAMSPFTFGNHNDVPVPADYDGDHMTDLAYVRVSGGNLNWYIRKSGMCPPLPSTCGSILPITFGLATDQPLAKPYFYDPWY